MLWYIKKGREEAVMVFCIFFAVLMAIFWLLWFLNLPLVKNTKNQETHFGYIKSIDSTLGKRSMTTIHLNINGGSEANKYYAAISIRTTDFNRFTPALIAGTKIAVEIKEYEITNSKPWCIVGLKAQDKPEQTILKISPSVYGISGVFEKFDDCSEVLISPKAN